MTGHMEAGRPEAGALPPDYLAQIVDGADYGIYCLDVEGKATYLNRAAEALLGFPRHALLGVPMHAAIHHTQPNGQTRPKEDCSIHLAMRDGAVRRAKSDIFWRADGTSIPVEYVSTPLRRGTTVIGAAISFQDISDRQGDEAARLQAIRERAAKAEAVAADTSRLYAAAQERIRSQDEFFSVAAHELRTPVTALRGFAQLALRRLKRGTFDVERGRLALEEIDEQTTNLIDLVNQLLEVSRLDIGTLALDRQPVDVVAAVAAAVRASAAAHVLTTHSSASLPAFLDAARFEQIVASLIHAVATLAPDGGAVEVEVSSPLPNTGQITVRGRGASLPAEQRDHLFDRFSQAQSGEHYWSFGLALYLSRKITELHGGTLAVDAPPDGGTRFTLLFPLRLEAGVDDPVDVVHRPPSPGSGRRTPPAPPGAGAALKAG